MSITMEIEASKQEIFTAGPVPYAPGLTGIKAMQAITKMYAGTSSAPIVAYKLKTFSFGDMLVVLDAIEQQNGADGHTFIFWELLKNGQFSNVGIDELQLNDGDKFEWNFTAYEEAVHKGTIFETMRDEVMAEMVA